MLLNKYSDFGGGKKKSDSEFLSYNLMLNSEKKKNSNSRVVPRFFLCTKKKQHSPSCKLNGRSLTLKQ